jgi:hypothetical protein
MPSRMIEFDALWASEKLASCESSTRVEYVWLYGLADANGSFELNMRSIHSRVSAIRPRLTARRLEQIFAEFEVQGLLFTWKENGKRYGHWTGSDRPGRLPKLSERHRYKKFAPNVPKEGLAEYESRCGRDVVATTSPLGVGVEVGLALEGKGDGKGLGEGALKARGVGAPVAPLTSSTSGPGSASEDPLAKNASTSSPLPFRQANKTALRIERPTRRYFCEYCREDFADSREFNKHDCNAKTRGGWECITCHATFDAFSDLKEHRRHCLQEGVVSAASE